MPRSLLLNMHFPTAVTLALMAVSAAASPLNLNLEKRARVTNYRTVWYFPSV